MFSPTCTKPAWTLAISTVSPFSTVSSISACRPQRSPQRRFSLPSLALALESALSDQGVSVLLVLGLPGNSHMSFPIGIAVFDGFVAPAGSCYEPYEVKNRDGSAPVGYELAFPHSAHCHADAHPPHAQHECKKFLGNAKLVGVDAVSCHQQPTGHALCRHVESVARRSLRDLDPEQVG